MFEVPSTSPATPLNRPTMHKLRLAGTATLATALAVIGTLGVIALMRFNPLYSTGFIPLYIGTASLLTVGGLGKNNSTFEVLGASPKDGRTDWPLPPNPPSKAQTEEEYWKRVANTPAQITYNLPDAVDGLLTGKTAEELTNLWIGDFHRQSYSLKLPTGSELNIANTHITSVHNVYEDANYTQVRQAFETWLEKVVPNSADKETVRKEITALTNQRSVADLTAVSNQVFGFSDYAPVVTQGPWRIESNKAGTHAIIRQSLILHIKKAVRGEPVTFSTIQAAVVYDIEARTTQILINRPTR